MFKTVRVVRVACANRLYNKLPTASGVLIGRSVLRFFFCGGVLCAKEREI